MADFTVRYADFKGGDWGVRDPSKANADTFSGVNVYRYDSGLLGVRAGFKLLPISGVPNHTVVPGPHGFWAHGSDLVIVIGNRPYAVPMAGGAAVPWAIYPETPLKPIRFLTGAGVPYSLMNNKLYKHPNAATTTLVTTPVLMSTIVRWGYYFVGVDATRPWRIWFSTVDAAGAQFDTWGVNDFIDIGDTEAITALTPIFNTLYVGKISGWNAVSGVLGTLASLRGVAVGNGPVDPRLTTVTTDNRVIYWPKESAPAWWNGERVRLDKEQLLTSPRNVPPCDTVVVTGTSERLILAADDGVQTFVKSWRDNAWTNHEVHARLGGFAPADPREGEETPEDVIYGVLGPTTVGDPVRIFSYHHGLDRPGNATDPYSSSRDATDAYALRGQVRFPSYWEPIGRQARVRSVIVQFVRWPSGVEGDLNEIQMRVNALGRYGGGALSGDIHRWNQAAELSDVAGTDDSWRTNFGEQGYGNGFEIEILRMVGVAVREVVVLCDVRTERV